jgi:hypothetical protein
VVHDRSQPKGDRDDETELAVCQHCKRLFALPDLVRIAATNWLDVDIVEFKLCTHCWLMARRVVGL